MYEYESSLRYDGVYIGRAVPLSAFYERRRAKTRHRCQSFKKPTRWLREPKPRPYRILLEPLEAK
jgi:hypothetical protein